MFWIERSEGPSNRMAAEQEAEKATLFQEAVTRTRQQQEAQALQTPPQPPQTQADNPPAAQPVLPQSPPPTPNGTVIHKIRQGDTTTEIGGQYGFSVEELGLISPGIEKNPDLIFEGDTLVLPTRKLFDDTKAATAAVQTLTEARNAQPGLEAKIAAIKDQVDGSEHHKVAAQLRPLEQELASLREKTATSEDMVTALLLPGFREAARPAVHDATLLRANLDTHAAPLLNIGRRQPGFDAIVLKMKEDVEAGTNQLFQPLRPAISTARQSGDWSPVRAAALEELKKQAGNMKPPDAAARAIVAAWINASSDPGAAPGPDAQAFKGAEADFLDLRPKAAAAEVAAAAPPRPELLPPLSLPIDDPLFPRLSKPLPGTEIIYPKDYRRPDPESDALPPELDKLEQVTRDVPAETAGRILEASQPTVDRLILDLRNHGSSQQTKILAQLSTLADRATTPNGQAFVDRTAAALVAQAKPDPMVRPNDRRPAKLFGEAFATVIGKGVSLPSGTVFGSPKLAIAFAGQLDKGGQRDDARTVIDEVAGGIDTLRETGQKKGEAIRDEIFYPAQVAGQNLRPDEADRGFRALVDARKSLVADAAPYGVPTILAHHALMDVPATLKTDRLQAATNKLTTDLNDRDSGLWSTTRMNPDAMEAWSHLADADRHRDATKLSDSQLDDLVAQAKPLLAKTPLIADMAGLADGAGARRRLRDNPDLAILLQDLVQESGPRNHSPMRTAPDGVPGDAPGEMPKLPSGGFVIRTIDDQLHALHRPGDGARIGLPSKAVTAGLQAWGGWENLNVPGLWNNAEDIWNGDFQPDPNADLIGPAWGAWFSLNTLKYSGQIYGTALSRAGSAQALEKGVPKYLATTMPAGIDKFLGRALPVLTLVSTIQAARDSGPIETTAWIPGLLTSLPGTPAKVSAPAWLFTSVTLAAKLQYDRVKASNHYEEPLGIYLKAAKQGQDIDKTSSLANCDEDGRPFLALLPQIGLELGYDRTLLPELTDWFYKLPRERRDMLVDRALHIKPDENGLYPTGEHGKYPYTNQEERYWPLPGNIWDFIDFAAKNNTPLPDRRQRNG